MKICIAINNEVYINSMLRTLSRRFVPVTSLVRHQSTVNVAKHKSGEDYKILSTNNENTDDLVRQVNEHLRNGWLLNGAHNTVATRDGKGIVRTSQCLVYWRTNCVQWQ